MTLLRTNAEKRAQSVSPTLAATTQEQIEMAVALLSCLLQAAGFIK
jgi:hypothetical protein